MGTEIFRPQDCLNQRLDKVVAVIPAALFRRPDFSNACNPRFYHRKHAVRRIPDRSNHATKKKVVAGQVAILRRGESLESNVRIVEKNVDDDWKILPEPEKVQKLLRIEDLESFLVSPAVTPWSDMYAGSAFAMSPSPSALPVPSFSKTKQVSSSSPIGANSATHDLRRLLRLD